VVRVLRSPVDAVSCALLPASCALCGSPLPRLSSVPICDFCWAAIPVLTGGACARCGDAVGSGTHGLSSDSVLCRACRLAPPSFLRAVAYGLYQGRLREAIHAFKYGRLHPAARGLGRMLASAIAQLAGEAPTTMLVVPVPLHRTKHAQRGFNQARSLAREALKFLATSHPDWQLTLASSALMRLRATESQAGLTPRQRRMNLRGAFSVSNPAAVKDKHVLLVDDIMTTGTTARAAAQVLLRAGAASVRVATLARAQRATGFHSGSMDEVDHHVSSHQLSSQGQRSFL
jgi:ComF family protein